MCILFRHGVRHDVGDDHGGDREDGRGGGVDDGPGHDVGVDHGGSGGVGGGSGNSDGGTSGSGSGNSGGDDNSGGNSGSAVLDAQGRLVGLNFDSTIESVAADVVFDGRRVRKIHVDARYMLWMMDAIDGADHLLEEMGIRPRL